MAADAALQASDVELHGRQLQINRPMKEAGRGRKDRDRSRSGHRKRRGREAEHVTVIVHIDEIPMPERPALQPALEDCEVWVDPLMGDHDGHDWLNSYGDVEEIFPVQDFETGEFADRGYVRFADHDSAARCVDAGGAIWSESERIIASQPNEGKASPYADNMVSRILGSGGSNIIAVKEKLDASLFLRGKGIGNSPGAQQVSDRVHFVFKGSPDKISILQPALEELMANVHQNTQETFRMREAANVTVVVHLDEIPMPERPVLQPALEDCEVWIDPLMGDHDGHDWLNSYGDVEEIFPVQDFETGEVADRGYVRFADHDSAARCVDAGYAIWSESERILASQPNEGKASPYADNMVSRILGSGGSHIIAAKEKLDASLFLRGKGIGNSGMQQVSDRLHFVFRGSADKVSNLQPVLEELMAKAHRSTRETFRSHFRSQKRRYSPERVSRQSGRDSWNARPSAAPEVNPSRVFNNAANDSEEYPKSDSAAPSSQPAKRKVFVPSHHKPVPTSGGDSKFDSSASSSAPAKRKVFIPSHLR